MIEKWTRGLAAVGLAALSPALLAQDAAAPQLVPVQTFLSATTISGYVDTSAVWNPGTGNANPAPYAFNAGKQDGFNVNAVDVKIARALDEAQWSAGYVAELSYGPDARAIDASAYPIRQAYIELNMPVGNGLYWELGRWDSLLGYESSDSMKNPNYTRSYGKTFEPTENTGLLGSYKVGDALKLQAGVADTLTTGGLNARSDPGGPVVETKKSVLTLVTLTAPESWGGYSGSKLFAGFDYGEGDSGGPTINGGTGHDRNEWYVAAMLNTPVKGLTFGASWDWIHHVDVMIPGGEVYDAQYVNAIAAYASYKYEKLTVSARAEYANGPGLTGLLYATDGEPDKLLVTPTKFDKVLALTGTVQYELWDNVITRLEVRWDHAADGVDAFGGDGAIGSGFAPDKKNEVMLAANVIYKF